MSLLKDQNLLVQFEMQRKFQTSSKPFKSLCFLCVRLLWVVTPMATASLTQPPLSSSSTSKLSNNPYQQTHFPFHFPPTNPLHLQSRHQIQTPLNLKQHGRVPRREFLKGLSILPFVDALVLPLQSPLPSLAREVEVGSYLPPSPSNPSFVLFKASSKDTPALRAGQSLLICLCSND